MAAQRTPPSSPCGATVLFRLLDPKPLKALEGQALEDNRALVCQQCNTDKGSLSLSLGQWLTRLSRAGDSRADHVAAFIERDLAN